MHHPLENVSPVRPFTDAFHFPSIPRALLPHPLTPGLQSVPLTTGAWQYWDPSKVPTPGNEKIHLNLWQANMGAPGYGRRVHVVVAGFE